MGLFKNISAFGGIKMRVILFHIGDYPVRSYGIVVVLALLLSIGMARYLTRGTVYRQHIIDLAMYSVIGAIIGARFWHVFFFQWHYYRYHWEQIPAIWNGGLAIQGSMIGGFAAAWIYCKIRRLDLWELADAVSPAIVFGQGVGRIACFLNGDAFGKPTHSGFGIVYPPGTIAYQTYGSQPLWPAEVWEGQWDMIVFGLLMYLSNKNHPKGFRFFTYNFLYSLGRFFLEFLRGDSPRYGLGLTAGQYTSLAVGGLSVFVMAVLIIKNKRRAGAANV